MSLRSCLKRIGIGSRGSKDLTREEAREAVRLILAGEVHPVEFGAFCMALRMKGETDEELLGAAEALMENVPRIDWNTDQLVTVTPPLAGKDRLMVVTPAATLLAAELGARVLVISDREVPPKKGITSSPVFEALDLPVANDFPEAAQALGRNGWSCLDLSSAVRGIGKIKEWRFRLVKRSFFSTVEKEINPPRSPLLTSFFHRPYLDRMEAVFRGLDYPKTLVIQGTQGSCDPKTVSPTRGRLVERGKATESLRIDPESFGLLSPREPVMEPRMPKGCAEWTRRTFAGKEVAGRNAVILEAGLIVFLAGIADSPAAGIETVRAAWGSVSRAALGKIEAGTTPGSTPPADTTEEPSCSTPSE